MATENVHGELPSQNRAGMAHGCPSGADHDREVPEIDLLIPLTIRGVVFRILATDGTRKRTDGGSGGRGHESAKERSGGGEAGGLTSECLSGGDAQPPKVPVGRDAQPPVT